MSKAREVVLLHGWGVTASVWTEFASLLAPVPVHARDLPGYRACPACAPYTLGALAAAVSRTAPPRCDVVGWSLGGLVALAWALAAPRQIARLVLIAGTPSFTMRPDWQHGMAAEVLAEFEGSLAADRDGTLKRFAALQASGESDGRHVLRRLRGAVVGGHDAAASVLAGGLRILREADLRASLAAVRQPTLLLQGSRDDLVPPSAAQQLARGLPDARLIVLDGVGHAPFLSRPHETAAAARSFLDE